MDLKNSYIMFGQNTSPLLIISSAVLVLTLFFYIHTVGSYFEIGISPLVDRETQHTAFAVYIIDKSIDQIITAAGIVVWLALSVTGKARIVTSATYGVITAAAIWTGPSIVFDIVALISFPIAISLLIYNRFATKKILNVNTKLLLNYLAIAGIATGIVGIITSLAPLFSIPPESFLVRDYAFDIFLLLSSLSPVIIFFLIIYSPIKLLVKKSTAEISKTRNETSLSNGIIKPRTRVLCLLLFMLLSVALALIPHSPLTNDASQLVSADSVEYVETLNKLAQSNNPQEFLTEAFTTFSGDRPLALIFLYAIASAVPTDPLYAIDHVSIILGPALVLATFFLTRELTSNDTTSILASFLAAISFQTLIGIYSGIYANWLAIIIGYLSFVFLIRFLKVQGKRNLAMYWILLILLLFSHTYTWTILAMVTGIFLVVMYKLNHYHKKTMIILLLVLLSSVAIDVAKTSLTGTGGIERDVGIARVSAGPEQSVLLWNNLTEATQSYAGGQLSNFMLLALGIYWILRARLQDLSGIFLLVFFSIGVIPLLFGNYIIQARVLYDIPFQIPAAIALTFMMKKKNGALIVLPICIWLFAMSVRMSSNFT